MTKGGMGFAGTPGHDMTPGMTPGNYNDMMNLYNQNTNTVDLSTPGRNEP